MPVSEIGTKFATAWRGRGRRTRWLGWAAVHWILTAMLVVASLATAAYTGFLVRRLFTLDPGVPDAPAPSAAAGPAPAAAADPEPSEPSPPPAPPAASPQEQA
jgi:hypothetical protein